MARAAIEGRKRRERERERDDDEEEERCGGERKGEL